MAKFVYQYTIGIRHDYRVLYEDEHIYLLLHLEALDSGYAFPTIDKNDYKEYKPEIEVGCKVMRYGTAYADEEYEVLAVSEKINRAWIRRCDLSPDCKITAVVSLESIEVI